MLHDLKTNIQAYRSYIDILKQSRNKLFQLSLLVMNGKQTYSNSLVFLCFIDNCIYIYVLLINRLDLPPTLSCFSYPYILSYVIERACVRLTLLASNWLNRERLSMDYSYCLSVYICVTRQLICHRKTISASSDCLL
jgi:hypothetical protein